MGFKEWLTRHTSKPSEFARAYTSGLVELIEYLTASLIAFSGRRGLAKGATKVGKTTFESHFDMEMAGFEPLNEDITHLISPSIEEFKTTVDPELLNRAYKRATAFLCLYSENSAHKYMKPENAASFSTALYQVVAERSTCRFGFSSEPRQSANTINELLPTLLCKKLLNRESFGDDDGLGLLLNPLSLSDDGSTQYGFVVGSEKQKMGCASAMLKVMLEIDNAIQRCAQDVHW